MVGTCLVMALGLVWTLSAPAAEQDEPFAQHLDQLVPALMTTNATPGVAIALVAPSGEVTLRSYGQADLAAGTEITPATGFNVGSISKPLAAVAALRLVEAGTLDLDAPLYRYLEPWPAPNVSPEGLTLRHLLSHTGGLTMHGVPEYAPHEPVPTLTAALADPQLTRNAEPGTAWSYSGGGYMILQAVLEAVTRRPFAELLDDLVLSPLDMNDTTVGWPADAAQLATPYDDDSPAPYHVYAGAAAAGVSSTAADLARLLVELLAAARGDAERLLQPATAREMFSPAPAALGPYGTRYGLGFALWTAGDGRWSAGHDGQNTGWNGFVWMVPDTGHGIVALTNVSDAFDTLRWIKCDWIRWAADTSWRGLCDGRPQHLPPPVDAAPHRAP